jgi:hypothetical protein
MLNRAARRRLSRIFDQIAFEIVAAPDPLAGDEHLRRGPDTLFRLESVDLFTAGQHVLVDVESVASSIWRARKPNGHS